MEILIICTIAALSLVAWLAICDRLAAEKRVAQLKAELDQLEAEYTATVRELAQ